jgi:hypothetical protein
VQKEKRPAPPGSSARDETPSPYRSPEGRYGLGQDVTREWKERLNPTDWNRRFMIIGGFLLAVIVLVIFGVVVSKMSPSDAMPWVITVFNAIWGLLIAAGAYYFGKSRHDNTGGSATNPPVDPPASPPAAIPLRKRRGR